MSAAPEVSGPTSVFTDTVHFNTQGNADMVNLTEEVIQLVADIGLRAGVVTVFVPGRRAQSTSDGAIGVESAACCDPN